MSCARALATLAGPVSAGDAEDPPLLVNSAEDDVIVPRAVTDHALELLPDAPHAHLARPGVGHGFGLLGVDDPRASTCAVLAYLDAI